MFGNPNNGEIAESRKCAAASFSPAIYPTRSEHRTDAIISQLDGHRKPRGIAIFAQSRRRPIDDFRHK